MFFKLQSILIFMSYLFWQYKYSNALINCSLVQHWELISGRFDQNKDTLLMPVATDPSTNICGNTRNVTCCTSQTQASMMKRTTFELKQMVEKVNGQLVTLIKEKRHRFRDNLLSHLSMTESKVHEMFEENFQIIARHMRNPVQNLFKSFRSYLRPVSNVENSNIVFNSARFEKAIDKFYGTIFAPIFACVVTQNCPRGFVLKKNYTNCIEESYEYIKPFGNSASNLAMKIEQSLIFANKSLTFLDELSEFINSTTSFVWTNEEDEKFCQTKLYQLYYCQICNGLSNGSSAQICPSVMTQVLDHCLKNFQRFDDVFNKITAVFKLFTRNFNAKQSDITEKLAGLKYDIQDAILNVTINGGPEISSSVYHVCGAVQNDQTDDIKFEKQKKSGNDVAKVNEIRIRSVSNFKFSHEISTFAQNLSLISNGWFGRMLFKIYESSEVATNVNGICWNGYAFVRYSKSLETLATESGSPQATGIVAKNELDEKFKKRISETLQPLEKLKGNDDKMYPTVVNYEHQAANFMQDEGSGDSQSPPGITDDDDYVDSMQSSGDGSVGDNVSSGDEDGKHSTHKIHADDEIGLENLSTNSPKIATSRRPTKTVTGGSSSLFICSMRSITVGLSFLTLFHTVRWHLWRLC